MIRRAVAADAIAAAAIVDSAYAKYVPRIGMKPMPMLDDHAARIAAGQAWVFEDAGAVIGWLVLLDVREAEGDDHLMLDNIAVAPSHAGQGIGRALLRFTEAEAARRGYTEMRLYTHALMTENLAMYARAGWVETGRVTYKGRNRVNFSKPVAPASGQVAGA
jgi:ribosomal protein S18 acetylase RimI-like enzyme